MYFNCIIAYPRYN